MSIHTQTEQHTESNENYRYTVGMDLGDKSHELCLFEQGKTELKRDKVSNKTPVLLDYFSQFSKPSEVLIAMEVGTHSPWI